MLKTTMLSQKLKKSVCLLLAILMLCSVFTIVPLTAFAASTTTPIEYDLYTEPNSSTCRLSIHAGTYNNPTFNNIGLDKSQVTEVVTDGDVYFTGSCSNLFHGFMQCQNMDLSSVHTAGVTDMSFMFYKSSSYNGYLKLDASNWDTSSVTDMSYMFYCCSLQLIDKSVLASWDTSGVTDMSYMFYNYLFDRNTGDSGLLSSWNTSNVTNMSHMFYNCNLSDQAGFSSWDTGSVTDMSYMFYCSSNYSTRIMSVDYDWNTSNVTDMSYMFYGCRSMQNADLNNWNTSRVTNMNSMFRNCSNLSSLSVSDLDTSCVTDMSHLFRNCRNLLSIDLSGWNTASVTDMCGMFYDCEALTSIDFSDWSGWDTQRVSNMSQMFRSCTNLREVDISTFQPYQVRTVSYMFFNCTNLTSVVLPEESHAFHDTSYMFSQCDRLTSLDLSNIYIYDWTTATGMFYKSFYLNRITLNGETQITADMRLNNGGSHNWGWKNADGSDIVSGEDSFAVIPQNPGQYTTYVWNYPAFFAGHTLSLSGDIGINFFINPIKPDGEILSSDDFENGYSIRLNYSWDMENEPVTDLSENDIIINSENYERLFDKNTGLYKVKCNVCAAEMSCPVMIDATIIDDNGDEIAVYSEDYSVRDYALTIINSEDGAYGMKHAQLVSLCKAMLDYGTKAQAAFNVNTSEPANEDIDYTMQNVTVDMVDEAIRAANDGSDRSDMTAGTGDFGLSYYGSSVVFLTKSTLRHYYTIDNEDLLNEVKDDTNFTFSDRKRPFVYFEKQNISAKDLDVFQPFRIGSHTYYYSGLDYVKTLMSKTTTSDANHALAKATYWYNHYANGYFENLPTLGTVRDVITSSDLPATTNSYQYFSDVQKSSQALYTGNSAKSAHSAIQLRWKNGNSGLVSTRSGGKVKKVTVKWSDENPEWGAVCIYGSNDPYGYTAANQLYCDEDNNDENDVYAGDYLGTIGNSQTELQIDGDYAYVGIRSNGVAIYLQEIVIEWYGPIPTGSDPSGEDPSGGGTPVTGVITDELTRDDTTSTNNEYTEWSGVKKLSDARYSGKSAGMNSSIQLRSKNSDSGIITTVSGGKATKVEVVWNSNTKAGRTLNIYGKDEAYTSPSQLFNTEQRGDLIGTIEYGVSTSLDISEDYPYIGLCSDGGAMYLAKVSVTWDSDNYDTPLDTYTTSNSATYSYDRSTGELRLLSGSFNRENKWDSGIVPAQDVTSVFAEDGVTFTGDCSRLFENFSNCTKIDLRSLHRFSEVTSMESMFSGCTKLADLQIDCWDNAPNVTSMAWMFSECRSLTSFGMDIRSNRLTNLEGMFNGCEKITDIYLGDRFDASHVTDMKLMFNGCRMLRDIPRIFDWNTSSVETTENMFSGCEKLTRLDLSGWDTSHVTTMASMFYGCKALTTLDVRDWDTSSLVNAQSIFEDCSSLSRLDVSDWDMSSARELYGVFRNCSSLTRLDVSRWDVSSARDMGYLFSGCIGLTSLDLSGWDTGSVTGMYYTFSGCIGLSDPAALGIYNWDVHNVQSMDGMFSSCKFTSIDLRSWNTDWNNTDNLIGVYKMFYGCSDLTTLNLDNLVHAQTSSMGKMFYECGSLVTLSMENWDTSGVSDLSGTFNGCTQLESLDLSGWDTGDVYNMSYLFSDCISLTSLDIDGWNTGSVTDMSYMFNNCPLLDTSAPESFDTGEVRNMQYMFSGCLALTSLDLSGWDTSQVYDMQYMFSNCRALTSLDAGGWNTGRVQNMNNMFSFCDNLSTLDLTGWDTRSVQDMNWMFFCCYSLGTPDVSGWNTHSVTDMSGMFSYCSNLETLDLAGWDTGNVANMNNMFSYCSNLETLDLAGWDTRNVTEMYGIFESCTSLISLDVSDWDTANVVSMASAFNGCTSITSLDLSGWTVGSDTNIDYIFGNCSSLETIDISGFDISGTQDYNPYGLFAYCNSLRSLTMSGSMSIVEDMQLNNGENGNGWMIDGGDGTRVSGDNEYAVIASPEAVTTYVWISDN